LQIPYFKPWITKKDKIAVYSALSQRWLTNGPFLQKFEKKICNYVGTRYCIGVGSATHALHLAVKSIGIKKGDEVVVPTFTFIATANAVKYCNAKPILVDVDADTFNISPSAILKNITKKTKAIIVVHYGGQSCDMKEIISIAKKYRLLIIEDCAHALGSIYKNSFCGSLGIAGCFSFYPTKIITTGEGGAVTTNNQKIFKKIKLLKSQGMDNSAEQREKESEWKYDIVDLGFNYRLDEMRSALGLSQLKRIKKINQMRIKIAEEYNDKLDEVKGISIPQIKKQRNHIYHLYTIKIDENYSLTRNQLFKKFSKNGIGCSVQYWPIHLMSLYKNENNRRKNSFSNANKLKDQVLCLPIFPTMTKKQINKVVSIIKN